MAQNAVYYGSYSDVRKIPSDNRAQIGFAGRSNVGKSTLLNTLVGQKKLARTSKTPGRTRLINFFLIDNKFYFVDLPGYGYAKASKMERIQWGRLVESYFKKRRYLKGLVLLLDCRREPNDNDLMMLDWLVSEKVPFIVALTKSDKLSKNNLIRKIREIENDYNMDVIPFSAQSGLGKKELWQWIETALNN